jgi:calcineurin-like phosphoesterase family protein
MNYFFTADWHFHDHEHDRLFRPMITPELMAWSIIENINKMVKEDDELWVLGDVAVGRDWDKIHRKLGAIKCKNKKLILGNKEHEEDLSEFKIHFDIIGEKYSGVFENVPLDLAHFPTDTNPNVFSLCGHIHSLWKVKKNLVNVGVDAWHFNPVPLETIKFIKSAMDNVYDKNVFL